jgi:hypothetical protein
VKRPKYAKVLLTGSDEELNKYIEDSGKCLVVDWRAAEDDLVGVVVTDSEEEVSVAEWPVPVTGYKLAFGRVCLGESGQPVGAGVAEWQPGPITKVLCEAPPGGADDPIEYYPYDPERDEPDLSRRGRERDSARRSVG